jgi:hypothetical protein
MGVGNAGRVIRLNIERPASGVKSGTFGVSPIAEFKGVVGGATMPERCFFRSAFARCRIISLKRDVYYKDIKERKRRIPFPVKPKALDRIFTTQNPNISIYNMTQVNIFNISQPISPYV